MVCRLSLFPFRVHGPSWPIHRCPRFDGTLAGPSSGPPLSAARLAWVQPRLVDPGPIHPHNPFHRIRLRCPAAARKPAARVDVITCLFGASPCTYASVTRRRCRRADPHHIAGRPRDVPRRALGRRGALDASLLVLRYLRHQARARAGTDGSPASPWGRAALCRPPSFVVPIPGAALGRWLEGDLAGDVHHGHRPGRDMPGQ